MEEKLSEVLPTTGLLSRVTDVVFVFSLVVSAEVQLVELYSRTARPFCYYRLWLVTLGSGFLAQAWWLSPTSVTAGVTDPPWRWLWLPPSFILNDQPSCSWLQGHSGHTVLNSDSLLVIPPARFLIPYLTILNWWSISHISNIFVYLYIFSKLKPSFC